MRYNSLLLFILIIIGAAFIITAMQLSEAFSRVIHEKGKSYIVDMHGERWDVTEAQSIGFIPERFHHGIGRNAFTPLDDSNFRDDNRTISKSLRIIGISDGKDAHAYSINRLWRHEIANSHIGNQPISAAY